MLHLSLCGAAIYVGIYLYHLFPYIYMYVCVRVFNIYIHIYIWGRVNNQQRIFHIVHYTFVGTLELTWKVLIFPGH